MGREFNFPKFRAGEPLLPQLSAERLNAIIDAIGRNRIEFGDNVTGQRTPGGTIVRANAKSTGGDSNFPFLLQLGTRPDEPTQYLVGISDGKVNNEWPDVGTDAMGVTGSRSLNITNVENCNVFIRVMFNARTNNQERLDIFERPNETYPTNKITWLDPATAITPDACDAVDNPDDPPPAGYGAFHIMLGFTYLKPPPVGAPPGTPSTPTVFNLMVGNVNYALFYGADDGIPSVLPVATYSPWTKIPQQPPP
jgi:hypothetical protein